MAGAGGPAGGKEVAHQHGGEGPVDDARLKVLIQEAVDEALRAIAKGGAHADAIASQVARRLDQRAAEAPAAFAALEGRLKDVERAVRAVDDRHARAETRIEEITLHVGHREPVDVGAVPPDILERSFQAALDEITGELAKVKARDEVERMLDEALADVRGRSKGSELFERIGGRIVIRGLGAAVGRKLLSARAAQASFDDVVKHLRIHVPGYKPRSLAAIIRARSHDFAVESALTHRERLRKAEEAIGGLLNETRRIEAEAREADAKAAAGVSKSFMQALAERRSMAEGYEGRLKALERRAAEAEARLEKALARLESVERYASRVEAAMIRRTKDGTFKGDFTPVIEAVHEALKDGKARTIAQVAKRVKGVDREVVEAVVREGVRERDFEEMKGGKVRRAK